MPFIYPLKLSNLSSCRVPVTSYVHDISVYDVSQLESPVSLLLFIVNELAPRMGSKDLRY